MCCSAASTRGCIQRRPAIISRGPATASGPRCTRRASRPDGFSRGKRPSCSRTAAASRTLSHEARRLRPSSAMTSCRSGRARLAAHSPEVPPACCCGGGHRRVPHRVRSASRTAGPSARRFCGRRAMGAAQYQRPQRESSAGGLRTSLPGVEIVARKPHMKNDGLLNKYHSFLVDERLNEEETEGRGFNASICQCRKRVGVFLQPCSCPSFFM